MSTLKTGQSQKALLHDLSSALKSLHKDLLQFQARHAEEFDQQRYSPYHLLHLSLHDDRFTWLRTLSALISRIDHLTHEEDEIEILDLQSVYDQTWDLLHDQNSDFSAHLQLALNQDPHLYMKQGSVLGALSEIQPQIKSMHEMHALNEEQKMKGF